ncbi:tellurite resistance protein TerB [Rubidibacter lacunae KORDI 51-2]|uniref:Tellurite resistance protein TerB n=1 Tax=Rubidibacter lacunae KORDI 51-2 TaxID=582515 RepID=U5DJ80_9CHRO|nr:TerB family tellurite resistance protein [Rubidibacter lacunae]ERN40619.1 tellurite resistance protein TerB [Rubidibacter lacunae KORDI 51-2]
MAKPAASNKQLLKILIGAAWLDGQIQPEERNHLNTIAQQQGLADDPEIAPLLSEQRVVSAGECHRWLEDYLGAQPSSEDRDQLLESLSALIYCDNNVDISEAQLLSRIQSMELPGQSPIDKALRAVQRLYRSVVSD